MSADRPDYRRQRLAAGLGLRDVARRVGISATHLSDVERGNRGASASVAERIKAAIAAGKGGQRVSREISPERIEVLKKWVLDDDVNEPFPFDNAEVTALIAAYEVVGAMGYEEGNRPPKGAAP